MIGSNDIKEPNSRVDHGQTLAVIEKDSIMYSLQAVFIYALPVVIIFATIEAFILAFWLKRAYDWRAYCVSMIDGLGRQYVVTPLIGLSLATPAFDFAIRHRMVALPLDPWAAGMLLFAGQEFCYYWFHRCSHRIRWFWATHAVHHSSNELNLSAAYRFGWTGRISGNSVFFAPLIWLGFPPIAVFGVLSLNLLYQFWLHTEWIPKLGWLEYVLNTPSHHRVHHAANLPYLDANYGGVLIIFDRLFGTLTEERNNIPCHYGLLKPLRSYNPVWIVFHEWVAMGRDVRQARSWRARFRHMVGPPGWRPHGQGMTTADLRRIWRARSWRVRYGHIFGPPPCQRPDGQGTRPEAVHHRRPSQIQTPAE